MLDFNFVSPTKIFFGKAKEEEIGKILKGYNIQKILIVIGQSSVKKSGLLDKVLDKLNNEGIKYLLLEGIEANPKIDKVRIGQKLIKENPVDLILAIGGGSVIDTAKSIACSYYLDDNVDPWELSNHNVVPTKALPVGVILTISAAGSELSNSCVISNPELKIKNGFNTDLIRPLFVIENPELTYSVSKFQTGCGIVDIIMHTIERYLVETENNYFEEEVALGLIKAVIKAGSIVINNPNDYDARSTLMLASSFSHNGLTGLGNSFYFTVHKLEHELSGSYDFIAHGAGLSCLFTGWAKFIYPNLPYKFSKFSRTVMNIDEEDDYVASLKGIEALDNYFKSLGMPTRLREFNLKEEDLLPMAKRITKNNTVKVNGFVPLNEKMVYEIFKLAY